MRRPWNIVDVPVYSLATYAEGHANMNICTYVSAVSMQPKMYMIAIDYKTKTYENLNQSEVAVLQLLHRDHASLIRLLGKKSGKTVDKAGKLKQKHLLTEWQDRTVLSNAAAYLLIRIKSRAAIGGDHELFYFSVEKAVTQSETEVLMFQELIEQGIIL